MRCIEIYKGEINKDLLKKFIKKLNQLLIFDREIYK